MKRNFCAFFLVLGIFFSDAAFAQNTDGFKIKGFITGLKDNSKVYLIDGKQRKILDSATVMRERFLLTGNIEEPTHTSLYSINDGKQELLSKILLSNTVITVSGAYPSKDGIKITGSTLDFQWKEWMQNDQVILNKRQRLKEVYESLVKRKDTASASVIEEVINDLSTQRVALLKTYVKKNYNNATGALLPTVSGFSDQLSKNDCLEMYNALSPEVKNLALGRDFFKLIERKN